MVPTTLNNATMKSVRPIMRISPPSPYVCNNCLLARNLRSQPSTSRLYTTTETPPAAGYAKLHSRRLISLSGSDATNYLQGVITANVSPATARSSLGFYAAFLNAQGRLLNDVFIYPQTDGAEGWLVEVDANEAERLAKHIKRYKLRAKFEVRLLEFGEKSVWSLWRDGEAKQWTAHTLSSSSESTSHDASMKEGESACVDQRAPGMGTRLILPTGRNPEADMEESTEGAYRVRRYLKGVPEGQDELIREAALPQESNLDFMGGVDYRKGCYVGQELTIRTHHTGVVRKRILPVMLYGMDEPMPTALEYRPDDTDLDVEMIPAETSIDRFEKRGRSAGKWLSGVGNIGLGLCRLEIMTDVQVQGGAGGYKEGDEFKLQWEVTEGIDECVKVKAFVPPWHLTKQ